MDLKAESALARVDQFKRDRWPYVIGHLGATAALITIAWPIAAPTALLWFGVAHLLATFILALAFFVPFRREGVKQIPLLTYFGAIVANATLSSALLFDLEAARYANFALTVGSVLFAGAAGSFVTLP